MKEKETKISIGISNKLITEAKITKEKINPKNIPGIIFFTRIPP